MPSPPPGTDPRAAVRRLLDMKRDGRPIVAMTAYDVVFGRVLEEAGVDLILVGDSVGPVVLGYSSTLPVTLDEMIHHARAVKRGAPATPVVLDMPFMTYHTSVEDAVANAGRAMKEAGVDAVKLEGGETLTLEAVRAIAAAGIPVMGHLGTVPQSAHAAEHLAVDAASEAGARVGREARALEDAGAFGMVLAGVASEVAGEVSRSLSIPTVGIGSGTSCDGQILVLHDALGLTPGREPRVRRRFADLHAAALQGILSYAEQVRDGSFPEAGPEA